MRSLPTDPGGLAQLARAPALHAGGHRFESDILHQQLVLYIKMWRKAGRIASLTSSRVNINNAKAHGDRIIIKGHEASGCYINHKIFDIMGKVVKSRIIF